MAKDQNQKLVRYDEPIRVRGPQSRKELEREAIDVKKKANDFARTWGEEIKKFEKTPRF